MPLFDYGPEQEQERLGGSLVPRLDQKPALHSTVLCILCQQKEWGRVPKVVRPSAHSQCSCLKKDFSVLRNSVSVIVRLHLS
jgi:hypothetical protein